MLRTSEAAEVLKQAVKLIEQVQSPYLDTLRARLAGVEAELTQGSSSIGQRTAGIVIDRGLNINPYPPGAAPPG